MWAWALGSPLHCVRFFDPYPAFLLSWEAHTAQQGAGHVRIQVAACPPIFYLLFFLQVLFFVKKY
jgi:hypothetical protein